MTKRTLNLVAVSLILLLFAASAFSEESLFVQPFKAKIFAKPSIAADVLGMVDSGFQFVSDGKEGSWIKLTYKGKPGFVPAVQTAKTPPLGKSVAQNVDAAPKLGARARTSSSSAVVAGMKGLTYEDRARITKGERRNFDSLDKVEALKISPEELKQFQLEGGKR
jgi:hypothetical protein